MHLTPHEQERLLIHVAADVAQRRRENGLLLNYPEVVALLSSHVYEQARAGATVDAIMESGRHVLTRGEVMEGVPEMIDNIQVEATFPDGTKLVTIQSPFEELSEIEENEIVYPGKLDLVPEPEEHKDGKPEGEKDCVRRSHGQGDGASAAPPYFIEYNAGEESTWICVKNVADRPIQVGSHFHFYEANVDYVDDDGNTKQGLEFDRDKAYGKRLNIASGTSKRFEPDDECWVPLVLIKGEQEVKGLQGDEKEIGGQPIRKSGGKLFTDRIKDPDPADSGAGTANGNSGRGRK